MKQCVFLTSRYPYGKTESFIENEISFLSNCFGNVIIISLDSGKGERRKIPNNVNVFSLGIWDNHFLKPLRVLFGLLIRIKQCHFTGKGIKALIQYWFDKGTSIMIYRRINTIIKRNTIKLNECVFYSYWLDNNAAAISLFKQKKDRGHEAIYISRAHGSDLYSERTPFNYLPMQNYCVSNLDYVFPISKHGEQYLKDKYPLYSNKIKSFYLGTSDHGLSKYQSNNQISFLTCSNIIPLKRLDVFAEAFCELSKRFNVKWFCIGSGSDENKIKKIIFDNKCTEYVAFMGRLSNMDVMSFYKKNNISYFVNVSKYEGLPVSIMEAMSFGVPSIATNVGAVNEIVNDENGFLIQGSSKESILTTLEKACSLGKEEENLLRVTARKMWEIKFEDKLNYQSFYNYISKEVQKND